VARVEAQVTNRLLATLKPRDLKLLSPDLEPVAFKAGDVLFAPGQDVTHVFFPGRDMVAALVLDLREGETTEAAMVGPEGAVGAVISQGEKPAFSRGVVQVGGSGYRLSSSVLDAAKQRSPELRDHFARYADCLMAQVLQSTACNSAHELENRLARWLLTLQDRIGRPELHVTQEFIAQMLGVRRSYVTRVIGALEDSGSIRRGRGVITVTDRRKLERQACECYETLRRHFDRVLPGVYSVARPE
jgi:CRP-like cAMP-binding protein